MRRYTLFALVAGLGAGLDLATKAWVESRFTLYESVPVVDGFFSLTYVRNPGAAFGILSWAAEWRTALFVGVTLAALAGIAWMYGRLEPGRRAEGFGLALISGGALGNLADRVRYGEVVDFLDVYWRHHHWPAFNVADIAITVGAGLVILSEFTHRKRDA